MLIEMPVLDNALLGCAIAFTPLLLSLTFGAPVARAVGRGLSLVPRRGPLLGQMLLDWVSQDPKPSASVLQGLFFGRIAPPRDGARACSSRPRWSSATRATRSIPFSDSDMLVSELPDARLIEASSILELRISPERLTGEIVQFIDDCWGGPGEAAPPRTGAKHSSNGSGSARARRRPA